MQKFQIFSFFLENTSDSFIRENVSFYFSFPIFVNNYKSLTLFYFIFVFKNPYRKQWKQLFFYCFYKYIWKKKNRIRTHCNKPTKAIRNSLINCFEDNKLWDSLVPVNLHIPWFSYEMTLPIGKETVREIHQHGYEEASAASLLLGIHGTCVPTTCSSCKSEDFYFPVKIPPWVAPAKSNLEKQLSTNNKYRLDFYSFHCDILRDKALEFVSQNAVSNKNQQTCCPTTLILSMRLNDSFPFGERTSR